MPVPVALQDINARLLDVGDKQLEIDRYSTLNGITATAGGSQATSLLIAAHFNRVTTVTSAADSVKLPPAVAGILPIVIANAAAANSMNVFPSSGDAINALGANAAFAVAAGVTRTFYCMVSGVWTTQ